MALRYEDLTPEESARQEALSRSWESAQRDLADPVIRAELEHALDELDGKPRAPAVTAEEFLAQTEPVET